MFSPVKYFYLYFSSLSSLTCVLLQSTFILPFLSLVTCFIPSVSFTFFHYVLSLLSVTSHVTLSLSGSVVSYLLVILSLLLHVLSFLLSTLPFFCYLLPALTSVCYPFYLTSVTCYQIFPFSSLLLSHSLPSLTHSPFPSLPVASTPFCFPFYLTFVTCYLFLLSHALPSVVYSPFPSIPALPSVTHSFSPPLLVI